MYALQRHIQLNGIFSKATYQWQGSGLSSQLNCMTLEQYWKWNRFVMYLDLTEHNMDIESYAGKVPKYKGDKKAK